MSNPVNSLSSDAQIVGNVKFSQDLFIDATIDGKVLSEQGVLTIGPNAVIKGEVRTRSAIIFGRVEGKLIVAERCELRASSVVLVDLQAATLAMEEGAVLTGTSRVGRK